MCYSPENTSSFENLKEWLVLIAKHAAQDVVLYLVALKADLLPSLLYSNNIQNYINPIEGKAYAKHINLPFYQVSSLNSDGINELFSSLLRDIEEIPKFSLKNIQNILEKDQKLNGFSENSRHDGIQNFNRILPDIADNLNINSNILNSAEKKVFSSGSVDTPSPYKRDSFDPVLLVRMKSQFSNQTSVTGGSGKKVYFVKHDIRDVIDNNDIEFE